MGDQYNYKLIAEDNNYPRHGGIAALVGIYPSEQGAEFIRDVVRKRYPHSNMVILKTKHSLTVKYPENFAPERFNKK